MTRIIASRGTGKSTALLRMAIRENGGIATYSKPSIKNFVRIAEEIGVSPEDIKVTPEWAEIQGVVVASFSTWMVRPKSSLFPSHKIFVDELELCARYLLLCRDLAGYSISLEDEKW